jgi:hypothetical protein
VVAPAAALALAGCGGGSTPSVAESLRESLVARDLAVKSVVCVRRPERISGQPAYRCNVNFGDPHVQIYCAAIVDGELRAVEWKQAVRGALDREAAARECAGRLSR